jgi:hypothetical protein
MARFMALLETFELQLRAMAQYPPAAPAANGTAAATDAPQQPLVPILAREEPK